MRSVRKLAFVVLTMAWFGLVGPLLGGAPFNIFLIFIPLSYVIGLVPSLCAGTAYACCVLAGFGKTQGSQFAWAAGLGVVVTGLWLTVWISVFGGFSLFSELQKMPTELRGSGAPPFLLAYMAYAPMAALFFVCALGGGAAGVCGLTLPKWIRRWAEDGLAKERPCLA